VLTRRFSRRGTAEDTYLYYFGDWLRVGVELGEWERLREGIVSEYGGCGGSSTRCHCVLILWFAFGEQGCPFADPKLYEDQVRLIGDLEGKLERKLEKSSDINVGIEGSA